MFAKYILLACLVSIAYSYVARDIRQVKTSEPENVPNALVSQSRQVPVRDQVDDQMVAATGCRYGAVGHSDWLEIRAERYQGPAIVQRAFVRASEEAYFRILWDNVPLYGIAPGYNNNQFTEVVENVPYRILATISTPNILSGNAYVAFTLSLENGRITFGREGETPIFDQNLWLPEGTIRLQFSSFSNAGGKVLYMCRATE